MDWLVKAATKITNFEKCAIDNLTFRLHYRWTVGLLVVMAGLLGSKQYFGDPIDCNVEGVPAKIMDTYCWIHGTWTVPELTDDRISSEVAHPGVGAFDNGYHSKVYHRYYQWVPLVLLMTAGAFYLPRCLWKLWEEGTMKNICGDMSSKETDSDKEDERVIKLLGIVTSKSHRLMTKKYFAKYLMCELLNLINLTAQWFITDRFLNGNFILYGSQLYIYLTSGAMLDSPEPVFNPMERVFPKMTKCTFRKHGPSGEIQDLDGLCVLPLNIVNEKIYYFLWIWYIVLSMITIFTFIVRIVTVIMPPCRRYVLRGRVPCVQYPVLREVCKKQSPSEWFVLHMMAHNIHSDTFVRLLNELNTPVEKRLPMVKKAEKKAAEMDEKKRTRITEEVLRLLIDPAVMQAVQQRVDNEFQEQNGQTPPYSYPMYQGFIQPDHDPNNLNKTPPTLRKGKENLLI